MKKQNNSPQNKEQDTEIESVNSKVKSPADAIEENLLKEIEKMRKEAMVFQGNEDYNPLIEAKAKLQQHKQTSKAKDDEWMKKVEELKKHPSSHSIHACPEDGEDFECKCVNPKVQDQNFYCFEKNVFDKIFKGEKNEKTK